MNYFLLTAIAIVLVLFFFLGFRITGIGIYSWFYSGISLGFILLYPLVWYDILPVWADKIIRNIIHFDIGFLGILITFILIRDIVFVPITLLSSTFGSFAFTKKITAFIFLLSLILILIGYRNAQRGPAIVKVQIPIKNLPPQLENYTILQISDLHAGPAINRSYVQNVVNIVLKEKPDIVVLTGDIADGNFFKYKSYIEPIESITKKFPVLYITGNHEYIRDSSEWINYFKNSGMEVLLNEHKIIKKDSCTILFAGVIDPEVKNIETENGPNIDIALKNSEIANVNILLAHQPNIASIANKRFDLQLSGHTHGGQFFPWNFIIKLLQPFSSGLYKSESMWLYINPGTGFWGPPFRLGTKSEITLLALKKLLNK